MRFKVSLPSVFNDPHFLDAFRDLLRDTLTASAVLAMMCYAWRHIVPARGIPDYTALFFLATGGFLVLCWYASITFRNLVTLENACQMSPHIKVWRIILMLFTFLLVILLGLFFGKAIP